MRSPRRRSISTSRNSIRYLKPHLGETKLKDITRGAIRNMLVALRELGLSKRTAGMARATRSVILSDAADDGIVSSNPALELGRGRRKRADTQSLREKAEKVRPLTEQELALFLETAETKTPRFAAAFWAQAERGDGSIARRSRLRRRSAPH